MKVQEPTLGRAASFPARKTVKKQIRKVKSKNKMQIKIFQLKYINCWLLINQSDVNE